MQENRSLKTGWSEVTPTNLRCLVGACPAIFRTPSGSYVVVGRTLNADEAAIVLPNRVGSQETAIEIDASYIDLLSQR